MTKTQAPTAAAQHGRWMDELPKTDHVRFFLERDWTKSPLGPLAHWSTELQLFTRMVFADSRAACIWWGPDLVAIYNEAYRPLAGAAHPTLMGATFVTGYPDLYTGIRPFFDQCRDAGVGVNYSSAMSLIVERHGWREEAFFTGNFVPIGGAKANEPDGYYNSLVEVTRQRLADRRTTMLNRMASVPELTSTAVCSHILATLETNVWDIPMAMLYEIDQEGDSSLLRLRGHFGLPKGHNLIVDGQPLECTGGLIPDCRRANVEPLTIDYDDRFDSVSWQGFGSPPKKLAILPITLGSRIFGYLVVGTNPYRPFGDACEQFVRDIARMTSSIISATINHDESRRRQKQLEDDLAFSDMKLRHLIEHASVGMVHVSLDGETLWANDYYYGLCGTTPEQQKAQKAFLDIYHPDDLAKVEAAWEKLCSGINQVSIELKLNRMYTSPIGDAVPAQVQILAFPYRENGKVQSVMACATDISRLKWAQNFQARLAEEAREAKRQQEAFIDVVSHEMRNPLSAIVHCADDISSSLNEVRARLQEIPEPCLDALVDNVASAAIVIQCANHQKRIIDDVLTLSKLDSMLLSITPSAVKPRKLLASIINIFNAEFKSNNFKCDIEADGSLKALGIDYLYFDPSRVTQVFINLITNAIKFVQSSANPTIAIQYGATLASANPKLFFPESMFWASKSDATDDATSTPDWGTGEEIYLTFIVKDTGIGMRDKEVSKIFERFKQASAKTHVKYGGSGLGLFISKELTERQGGEIGVSSVWGQGSTFGFYIKTRRVERRPQSLEDLYQEHGRGEAENSNANGNGEEGRGKGIQVLLVEDNVINQQVLSRQLRKAGCVVEVANHGLEALSKLESSAFEVVLMDLEMPIMDGLTAMSEIRKRQQEGKVVDPLPIIAVTANVRKEQIDTAIAAGANRVMQKPFKAADLVYMMKGLVPQISTPEFETSNPIARTSGLGGSTMNGFSFDMKGS
ncbi:hypothetical protein P154DRAFT_48528 [Amniculicola lignicola CBS 123094]|uniref:histidine kinase n=1 Tax=Amniculicola lignicola CBS 123094 TaxID=1392246 RepID=A0A6A5W8A2_9PLEO|nr:hypothetical protein P154DRAFT_48528 [Amniculicola lignicola CBS 123094]